MAHISLPVDMAQRLVACDTISGGDERRALEAPAAVLAEAGFTVAFDAYDSTNPQRCSLVARLRPGSGLPTLCLCGHIDTVPLGGLAWEKPPLGGDLAECRLYGRGSCDMKSGVAAMVCAAARMAATVQGDVAVHIYGGEETGCEGSFHVAANPEYMNDITAVVVGEPTACLPLCGHKGALWLRCRSQGVTAHASMPHKGVNALAKLLPFAMSMLQFHPQGAHPFLGQGSCVLSTLHSGSNCNSVPDTAELTLDIRTVPPQAHEKIRAAVAALAATDVAVSTFLDIPAVWTDPEDPWVRRAFALLEPLLGHRPEVATVQFFTDAAALRPQLPHVPIIILGPGDPSMAHQVNENCPVAQIEQAAAMYAALLHDWRS